MISFLKSLRGLPSVCGVLISSHKPSRHAGVEPTRMTSFLPDLSEGPVSKCCAVTSQPAEGRPYELEVDAPLPTRGQELLFPGFQKRKLGNRKIGNLSLHIANNRGSAEQ